MRREPGKSLANDTVYNIVQAACFMMVAVGHSPFRGPRHRFVGCRCRRRGVLRSLAVQGPPTLREGSLRALVRWHMSKWLAGNSMMGWSASQASVLLAGFILGPAGLGALRAAQTLVQGPALVLIQAGGSIGLPEASRALARRGLARPEKGFHVVSAAGVASITIVGIAVVLLGGHLLRITYGPEFSRYWPALGVFALGFMISTIGLGPILILKTTRNTRSLFHVQLMTLVVSFAAVCVLAVIDGVSGAAAAAIVSSTANVIFLTHYGRSARRRLVNSEEESSGQDNSDAIRDSLIESGSTGSGGPAGGNNGEVMSDRHIGNTQAGRLPHIDQIRNNDAPNCG